MKRSIGSTTNSNCSPSNLRMRLRILPVLLKSTLAANSFPACIQVCPCTMREIILHLYLRVNFKEIYNYYCY